MSFWNFLSPPPGPEPASPSSSATLLPLPGDSVGPWEGHQLCRQTHGLEAQSQHLTSDRSLEDDKTKLTVKFT